MTPMVGSWEIETVPDPTKWFALARAYLNAGIRLCEDMISGTFEQNYSNAQVVLGLAHHSIELFYKGAIHNATGMMPRSTHNLLELEEELKRVAPEIALAFDSPFGLEGVSAGLDEKALKKAMGSEQDQRFRYHHDQNGNPWSGLHGFLPETFLHELRYCASQYDVCIPSNCEVGGDSR